ncbi:MAG: hypothetical protein AAFV29_16945, partial [Myxococcota bacterium]
MRTPLIAPTNHLTSAIILTAVAVACGGPDAEQSEAQLSMTLSLGTETSGPPTVEGVEWQPIGRNLFEGQSDQL